MDLLNRFTQFIAVNNLFQKKDNLLVAVSGGVDSVVLCNLCKQAGYTFVIAHCNFQLRGQESERDEAFVKILAKKYEVEILTKKFDAEQYADSMKKGIQEAARELRYEWFSELINLSTDTPINYLLTAHHADDNVETVLMNFFKGTGASGLRGILPKQKKIIRPLLFAKKDELLAYAAQNNLPFVEDSSNASGKYTRNYFRNELIPGLKKVYPQVEDNLIDNLHRFSEIEILYQQSIKLHKSKLIEQKGNEIQMPVLKLLKTVPLATVLFEIIKEFGFTAHQTNEIIRLLESETGKYIESASHRIFKNRRWLIIAPLKTESSQHILIETGDKKIVFKEGVLQLENVGAVDFKLETSNFIAQLSATEITYPLLLRKWKQGDYFYPLGMSKKKKLNRFFSDQKLSLTQKEKAWVLEMDKKIIWVLGMRIDNRFKIKESTKEILQIRWIKNEGASTV